MSRKTRPLISHSPEAPQPPRQRYYGWFFVGFGLTLALALAALGARQGLRALEARQSPPPTPPATATPEPSPTPTTALSSLTWEKERPGGCVTLMIRWHDQVSYGPCGGSPRLARLTEEHLSRYLVFIARYSPFEHRSADGAARLRFVGQGAHAPSAAEQAEVAAWAERLYDQLREEAYRADQHDALRPTVTPTPTPTRTLAPTATASPTPTYLPWPSPWPTAPPLIITEWLGQYYANAELIGWPALQRNDRAVDFDWGYGSPASSVPTDYFSARWQRRVRFSAGEYRFRLEADDGARLWVAGELLIDRWHGGYTSDIVAKRLASAEHDILLEYFELQGVAKVRLTWEKIEQRRTPTPTPLITGWRAEYYDNRHLSGAPRLVRNEEAIAFDWGEGSPHPSLKPDDFSARFTRRIALSAGTYRVDMVGDDGYRLFVNDALVLSRWTTGIRRLASADLTLPSGEHDLRIEYFEGTGGAALFFALHLLETPTPTWTATVPWTATATPLPTETSTATATATSTHTGTPTRTATMTAAPQTATPTQTPIPLSTALRAPTATSTPTPTPTETATAATTPSPTPEPTASPTATHTVTATPTVTPTETATPAPSLTPTATETPTETHTATAMSTATLTETPTTTATATDTPAPASTASPTDTPTAAPTETATPTPTATETPTATATATATAEPSAPPTATATETPTPTWTETPSPTETYTATPADTYTATPTATLFATETVSPTATLTGTLALTPTEPLATPTAKRRALPIAGADTPLPPIMATGQPALAGTPTITATTTVTPTGPMAIPTPKPRKTETALTLQAAADTCVDSAAPARSMAASWRLRLAPSRGYERRYCLVRFELPELPAGAELISASLTLQAVQRSNVGRLNLWIGPASRAWEETLTFAQAVVPPALRRDEPSVAGTVFALGPASWDVTAIVSGWLDGSLPNHGLLIEALGEENSVNMTYEFASREYGGNGLLGPRLTLHYYVLPATPESLLRSWQRLTPATTPLAPSPASSLTPYPATPPSVAPYPSPSLTPAPASPTEAPTALAYP